MTRRGLSDAVIGQFVVAVAREAHTEDLDRLVSRMLRQDQHGRLVATLAWHGLIGLGRRLLSPIALPVSVRNELDRAYYDRTVTVTRALVDLAEIAAVLQAADVEFAVLKGPVLARLYDQPMDRLYTDVDVLVRPADVARCIAALEEAQLLRRTLVAAAVAEAERCGSVPLWLIHGSSLDLHVSLLPRRWGHAFALDPSELLSRRREVAVEQLVVPCLSAADLLLHVTLHASVSGAYRLLWLTDLRRVMEVEMPPPPLVQQMAADAGLALPLGVLLDRGGDLLRDVGDIYAGASAGGAWRRALRGLDRLRPIEGGAVDGPSGRTVFAATRRNTATSLWALQREIVHSGFRRGGTSDGRGQEQQHYPEGMLSP